MAFRRNDAFAATPDSSRRRGNLSLAAALAAGVAAAFSPANVGGVRAAETATAVVPADGAPTATRPETPPAPMPLSPELNAATLRTSSDVERDPPPAADPVMLRMLAASDVAVPIEDLDDALVTTGSIAPRTRNTAFAPAAAPALPPEATALLSEPTPAPMPVEAAAVAAPAPVAAEVPPETGQAPPQAADPAGQAARIVSSVNMRTAPKPSARTVTILASNAEVTVIGCDYWCEIEADGKHGFVYKRFLRRH